MKERPILFSSPMVRAILDGRKTTTRRVIKPSVKGCSVGVYTSNIVEPINVDEDGDPWIDIKCPYGVPGDRLWVREKFWIDEGDPLPFYKATEEHPEIFHKWKPSIFMPRWASRITLEVTNVRVERLQEITEEDAIKEGYGRKKTYEYGDAKNWFGVLYEVINGKKYPWSSNPWVWVIEFELVSA